MTGQNSISWISKSAPNGDVAISKDEVTLVVEVGGGDAAAGSAGLPDEGVGGSVDEAEVAIGEELEGSRGVGGTGIGAAGYPDGYAVIGDGGEVGVGGIGSRNEAQGESVVGGSPSLVWAGSVEG